MMKLRYFLFSMLLLFSACKKDDVYDALKYGTIVVDGLERRYAVYVPQDFHAGMPVVFCLHGGGGTIEKMTGQDRNKSPYKLWFDVAENDGVLVVFPQALAKDKWPNWNDCRADCDVCPDMDDVKFLSNLIDTIVNAYRADTSRIYFCGVSNGGFMTLRMATCVPDKLAGIGVIIASLPDTTECGHDPLQPLPAMFINGTADPMLPYNGGTIGNPPDPTHGSCRPVDSTIAYFVRLNSCDPDPQVYDFPDLDERDNSTVTSYFYKSAQGNDVLFYKVEGGGHAAPSISEQYSWLWERYVGKQNHDIETVFEMWNFLKDKRLSD